MLATCYPPPTTRYISTGVKQKIGIKSESQPMIVRMGPSLTLSSLVGGWSTPMNSTRASITTQL
mgnify:CR=1 FL=1